MRTENLAGVGVRVYAQNALLLYFVGAYVWTRSLNLAKILAQRHIVSVPMPFIVLDIAAGLGPLVAALGVTSYEAGGAGRRALLGQLLRWRVPGRWYVIAVLGPVVLTAAAFGGWVATGGSAPPTEALARWTRLPVFFVYILLAGGGMDEELGWRGYALPRLQQRYGALIASVILGLFWGGLAHPRLVHPGLWAGRDLVPGLRGQRDGGSDYLHLALQQHRREPANRHPRPHHLRPVHDRPLVSGALHAAAGTERRGPV